jgi:hypothetical protein
MKHKFYVTDWAPNGTNGLIVRDAKTLEVIGARDEALFGVNVSKLRESKEPGEYRISKALCKKHVAASPIEGTFEDNCRWLQRYL